MLELEKLEQFTVLARVGSFTRAAAALHISQPTLTRTVQQLERQIGARLLDRGHNGVAATPIGERLLDHSHNLLRRAREIEEELTGIAKQSQAQVRCGYGPTIGSVLLPAIASDIVQQGLDITVWSVVARARSLEDMLLAGELDFFVARDPAGERSEKVESVIIGHPRIEFYVREGHPLTENPNVTFSDLSDYPRVFRTGWDELLGTSGVAPEVRSALRATIETDDPGAPDRLAREIDAIITSHVGVDHSGLAQLTITDRGDALPPRTVVLHTLHDRTPSAAVEHVIAIAMKVGRAVYGSVQG